MLAISNGLGQKEEFSVMQDSILLVAAIVTIVSGVSAFVVFFAKNSPFIITKRSTHRDLLSLRGNGQRNGNTAKNLEHITTADGRKWVWRKSTNDSNLHCHGVSFVDIAEAEIISSSSEGINPSELKRSFMKFRGTPYYCCIYYEGEGYNRVFAFFPPSDKSK